MQLARTPGGSFRREPDTAWPTRYCDSPIDLPAGSTIEVNAVLQGVEHSPGRSLFGADPSAPIRLVVDYATGRAPAD